MSTTSGSSFLVSSKASAPFPASPIDLKAGFGLEDQTEACPHELLVVSKQDADASCRGAAER